MSTESIIQLFAIVLFFLSMAITCKFAAVLSVKRQQHYTAGIWMTTILWTLTAIFAGWLS